MDIPSEVLDAILEHQLSDPDREVCGVLVDGVYHRCINLAANSQQFLISPVDFVRHASTGKLQAVVHTHRENPTPSALDKECCDKAKVPYLIVVPTREFVWLEPDGHASRA